jgi:hypothetical protein
MIFFMVLIFPGPASSKRTPESKWSESKKAMRGFGGVVFP